MQNLVFYGSIFGLNTAESEKRGAALLEQLALSDAKDQTAYKLRDFFFGPDRQLIGKCIRLQERQPLGQVAAFYPLLIVPIVLTVFIPTIFILALRFAPSETEEFQKLLALMPLAEQGRQLIGKCIRLQERQPLGQVAAFYPHCNTRAYFAAE